jgi:hypothetical protein
MNPDEEFSGYKTAEQLRFNATRKETQDITLTTKEGDVINISSLNQFQASYMSFDYSAELKDKSLSIEAEKFKLSTQNAFSISVEGDLNEEEKEDIAKILDDLDGIMADLSAGNIGDILNESLGILDGTETISSLDAVLKFRQQVSVEQRTMTQISGRGPLPPHPHHPGNPSEMAGGPPKPLSLTDVIAKISDKLMEIIDKSNLESAENAENSAEKIKERVKELFADLIEKLKIPLIQPEETSQNGVPDSNLIENPGEGGTIDPTTLSKDDVMTV